MGKWCNGRAVRPVVVCSVLVLASGCSSLTIPDVVTPVKKVFEPLGRSFDSRTYLVQPGDNLAYIAWRYQTTVDDLLAWNGLSNAGALTVGQPLQVRAPRGGAVIAQAPTPDLPVKRPAPQPHASDTVTSAVASSAPLSSQLIIPVAPATVPATTDPAPRVVQSASIVQPASAVPRVVEVEPIVEPVVTASVAQPTAAERAAIESGELVQVQTASRDGLRWAWPQRGKIVKSFSPSDTAQQGIDIAAGASQPIRAAADGIVAFAGNEVSVLGRTIIIDHQREFLSAYAKVGRLLVEEGDSVRVGDVIAETGVASDGSQFHFQIRRKGVPLNPLKYLPKGN